MSSNEVSEEEQYKRQTRCQLILDIIDGCEDSNIVAKHFQVALLFDSSGILTRLFLFYALF